jgi:hypothetical protein
MGTTYLTDGITGINLQSDEAVVAFLVSRNTTYPYDERVNEAPVFPCDLFRLNSLPIYGRFSDYVGIDVEADQLGVTFALQMSGCVSWAEFQAAAVHGRGVPFARKSTLPRTLQERQADARLRNYGLFVISRDTFNRVKRKARFMGEKAVRSDASLRREQVGEVMAMFDSFFAMQRFMEGKPTEGRSAAEAILQDKRKRLAGLTAAIAMEGATEYQNEAGDVVALPMLTRAFGDGHGTIFGKDFSFFARAAGFRGTGLGVPDGGAVPASAASIEGLSRFLELVWETQRLYFGMRYIGAHVAPSMTGGQRTNRVDVMDASRQTLEAAFGVELQQLTRESALPKQYKDLRLQLSRAKAAIAKLEAAYDEALVQARAAAQASLMPEPEIETAPAVEASTAKPVTVRKKSKKKGKATTPVVSVPTRDQTQAQAPAGTQEQTAGPTSGPVAEPVKPEAPATVEQPVAVVEVEADASKTGKGKYTVKIEVPF